MGLTSIGWVGRIGREFAGGFGKLGFDGSVG